MIKGNLICTIILTLLFLWSNSAAAQMVGDSFEQAKISKQATLIYLFTNTPGFTFENNDGEYKGISMDIMSAFEKYLKVNFGINIEATYQRIEDDDFPKMMNSVKNASGGVFGLGNITITEERKKVYQFSPPFMTNLSLLITHISAPPLTNIEDIGVVFKEMSAFTVEGSTNGTRLLHWKESYFPEMKISFIKSIPEAVNIVAIDSNAFTHVDFTYYLNAVENGQPVKRHIAGSSKSEALGIIMPRANDWADVLADFMNSGYIGGAGYQKIITQHLGEKAANLLESVK